MVEFKTIKVIKPNEKILNIIKNYKYQIIKGEIKTLSFTNLQFISPVQYIITYPTTLTILEYKVNEISNKPFYIKEYKQKYSLKKIKQILTKVSK